MAYILTGHLQAGPFPHKEGEFVGKWREALKRAGREPRMLTEPSA